MQGSFFADHTVGLFIEVNFPVLYLPFPSRLVQDFRKDLLY